MMYDNWQYGHNNNDGGSIAMFIFMLFMMAIVVVGIIALVHYLKNGSGGDTSSETALELLHNRYVRSVWSFNMGFNYI